MAAARPPHYRTAHGDLKGFWKKIGERVGSQWLPQTEIKAANTCVGVRRRSQASWSLCYSGKEGTGSIGIGPETSTSLLKNMCLRGLGHEPKVNLSPLLHRVWINARTPMPLPALERSVICGRAGGNCAGLAWACGLRSSISTKTVVFLLSFLS